MLRCHAICWSFICDNLCSSVAWLLDSMRILMISAEGPPLAEQQEEIGRLHEAIAGSPYRMRVDAEVALTESRTLAWSR